MGAATRKRLREGGLGRERNGARGDDGQANDRGGGMTRIP